MENINEDQENTPTDETVVEDEKSFEAPKVNELPNEATENRLEHLRSELEELVAERDELKGTVSKLQSTLEGMGYDLEEDEHNTLNSYHMGDFVEVTVNGETVKGKVLFVEPWGLVVGTAKGEVSVGDPKIIKPQ